MTIETGLSDHHKMTVTVLKTYFKKKKPIKINYRSYKYFNVSQFRIDLQKHLLKFNKEKMDCDDFKTISMQVLDWHAPKKKNNNAPFMNKVLSKVFMHRSKFKNRYNKNTNELNKNLYKKQRNFCVNLLRKEKRKYYNNLDINIFEENRKFWQNVRPLFSNKHNVSQKYIIIVEEDTVISNNTDPPEKLNNFFIEAVENLEIESFVPNIENIIYTGIIHEIVKNYQTHPSILKIKDNVNVEGKFIFNDTTPTNFKDEICKMDPKKASTENDKY